MAKIIYKMDKEIIKDFKEWIVPEKWDDVTLEKYQDIERFYEDKDKKFDIREALHILTDKSEDEVNELPVEFLEIILGKLSFLQTPPKTDKPTNKIVIDGETYVVNTQNKLKTGEYIASDTILKDDKHNYAAILAILCRKDGELYDSKFENEVVEERVKLFGKQPITKILPIIAFFLNLSLVSNAPTLLSLKVREEISRIRQHIENLGKNGQVSKRSMRSLMKKLKKLEKSISFT